VRQWQRVDDYRAGDYKWRYVRFSHDTAVWQAVEHAEQRYRIDAEQFVSEYRPKRSGGTNWQGIPLKPRKQMRT